MVNPIAFYLLAVIVLGTAVAVVTQRNILHGGLLLIVCFWCVAGVYLLLDAPFLAALQVLIYVGAISVLLLFAIMLTHRMTTRETAIPLSRMLSGWLLAALLVTAGMVAYPRVPSFRVSHPQGSSATLLSIAESFMSPRRYLVPFEIVGVLLLVALLGAVIIARKDEATTVEEIAARDYPVAGNIL